uniref:Leucine rich repeat containing 27 n=1 Tax=Sus scrofa TaxID=9823 RepID=A0A8D1JST5_PIG
MEGSSTCKDPGWAADAGGGASDAGGGASDAGGGAGQARSKPALPSRGAPEGVVFSSAPILDLSQSGLHHLGEIFKVPTLKQLHLQRNALCTIPEDFFQLLPNLTWLDLRYNRITALPSGIGCHKHLKTLLLERNPIKMLPVELGTVTTLKALNLRRCPLEFPPQPVVQKGLVAILSFLQVCAARHAPAGDVTPRAAKLTVSDLPETRLDLPEDCVSNNEAPNSQEPSGTAVAEEAGFLPPLGKLDLGDLGKAPDPLEDWPSREEIQRFWKLRQEIVEDGQAGVLENQLLPAELPPKLKAALSAGEEQPPARRPVLRTNTPRFKGILPDLASSHQALARARLQENRSLALQGLRDRQALRAQRRRNEGALPDWREQTLAASRRREGLCRRPPWLRSPVASKIPFATGLLDNEKTPMNLPGKMRQSKEKSWHTSPEASTFHEGNLQEKLNQHVQQRHDRRSRPRGLAPLGETRKAVRDLQTARSLQAEVMKLKLRSTLSRNPRCPALSGSHSLGPAASQSRNIFFNTKY